jgi:hypothetical protein
MIRELKECGTAFLRMLAIQFSKTELQPSIRAASSFRAPDPLSCREDNRLPSRRAASTTAPLPSSRTASNFFVRQILATGRVLLAASLHPVKPRPNLVRCGPFRACCCPFGLIRGTAEQRCFRRFPAEGASSSAAPPPVSSALATRGRERGAGVAPSGCGQARFPSPTARNNAASARKSTRSVPHRGRRGRTLDHRCSVRTTERAPAASVWMTERATATHVLRPSSA